MALKLRGSSWLCEQVCSNRKSEATPHKRTALRTPYPDTFLSARSLPSSSLGMPCLNPELQTPYQSQTPQVPNPRTPQALPIAAGSRCQPPPRHSRPCPWLRSSGFWTSGLGRQAFRGSCCVKFGIWGLGPGNLGC